MHDPRDEISVRVEYDILIDIGGLVFKHSNIGYYDMQSNLFKLPEDEFEDEVKDRIVFEHNEIFKEFDAFITINNIK